jgi:hypothetical protein
MRSIPVILAFSVLAWPSLAAAGEVFGKVTVNGGPVKEGTQVAAKCGSVAYPAVGTDKTGTYHLVLNESGKCTLTVTHLGQAASVDVVSFDDAVQADLVLATEAGKLTVRRK